MARDEWNDLLSLWQTQTPDSPFPKPDDVRRLVGKMERVRRRQRWDFCVALMLVSATIVALALIFDHPLLRAGAAASLIGFAFLTYEILDHSRRSPRPENGEVPSIQYHRALLEHGLAFHRTRLWLRVLSVAPGGVLFFLGFAAARPSLAPVIYVELATFALAVSLIVPVNRKAAAKLERQLEQLEHLTDVR
ncbi:MAG TPA: hypothetical protein VM733_04295 [Thermoanaerobaculia bacterium]|nr:hypothetical protein [Thermoanaerobaculia bacterium]